jgi:hypothetical protein
MYVYRAGSSIDSEYTVVSVYRPFLLAAAVWNSGMLSTAWLVLRNSSSSAIAVAAAREQYQ